MPDAARPPTRDACRIYSETVTRLPHTAALVSAVATLAVVGSSAAVVSATGLGLGIHKDASAVQYLAKPGCGPDTSDGVGGSGGLTVQPPKLPARQLCPNPPGQNTSTPLR